MPLSFCVRMGRSTRFAHAHCVKKRTTHCTVVLSGPANVAWVLLHYPVSTRGQGLPAAEYRHPTQPTAHKYKRRSLRREANERQCRCAITITTTLITNIITTDGQTGHKRHAAEDRGEVPTHATPCGIRVSSGTMQCTRTQFRLAVAHTAQHASFVVNVAPPATASCFTPRNDVYAS